MTFHSVSKCLQVLHEATLSVCFDSDDLLNMGSKLDVYINMTTAFNYTLHFRPWPCLHRIPSCCNIDALLSSVGLLFLYHDYFSGTGQPGQCLTADTKVNTFSSAPHLPGIKYCNAFICISLSACEVFFIYYVKCTIGPKVCRHDYRSNMWFFSNLLTQSWKHINVKLVIVRCSFRISLLQN